MKDLITPEELNSDANVQTGSKDAVVRLANKLLGVDRRIALLEQELEDANREKFKLETDSIPTEMDACGLRAFTLDDGSQIKVEALIKGSLPSKSAIEKADDINRPMLEARLADGLQFIRDSGSAALIKNVLKFEVDKGKDNVVPELIEIADKLGIPHKREESVNAKTLEKFIKERIRKGESIPMETFAVYNGRKAVVVKPKKEGN